MARHINQESILRTHRLLDRMGLIINEQKSKLVKATEKPFDFLGFTFRYDESIFNRRKRFWNITPRAKSQKKIRQTINQKLKKINHYPANAVVSELNPIIRGWVNYYRIDKVSYTQVALRKLDDYLRIRIDKFYKRKSQRKSNLHGKQAYGLLTSKYRLIKPYKSSGIRPVKALGRN